MTDTAPFTRLVELEEIGDGVFTAVVDPIWTIGPKVHGGCLMAVCAAAAQRTGGQERSDRGNVTGGQERSDRGIETGGQERSDRGIETGGQAPIAVSASYLAAPDPGPVRVATTVRKRGRQVSVVDVELSQGDRTAVTATVTLGPLDMDQPRHREPLALHDMPIAPPTDAVHITPDHPMGQVVHVAQGCDLRVDPSAAHYLSGRQGDPVNRMWLRPFADDESDPDTALLFALMAGDISAPVTMNLGMFGWAPTVQLTTYLRRRPAPGWMRVMASATVLGDVWFEEDHVILDSEGHVVVQSRQLAMIPKGV